MYDKLREYAKGDDYPLHMPGHKRRTFGALPESLFSMDITEIPDFDDLHAPEGVLKELEERVAKLYGADESFVLANGSTCGILSALSCALPEGGHLLMARNCHKSAYHAAYLRKLRLTYLMPPRLAGFGICDGISPKQVEEALAKDPTIQAVLIVSPTYEGRISPIREIAEVVHGHGKILIVDEAHGAHLGLGKDPGPAAKRYCELEAATIAGTQAAIAETQATMAETQAAMAGTQATVWPENSCQAGADLVIHSVHKTLPAMTQTALLHVNGDRVDCERLRRFLRIYQSSSPSYVLMASVDNAIAMIEQDGERLFHEFYENFTRMTKALGACKHLRILAVQDDSPTADPSTVQTGQEERLVFQDLGKLLIHAGDSGLTGQQIYDILREKYHLQLEMADGEYCLAMFTVGDTPEGYERTTKALLDLDHSLQRHGTTSQDGPSTARSVLVQNDCAAKWTTNPVPIVHLGLREAWDAPFEEISLEDCEGRIAAEFVHLYPPGTPIVAPGEAFTKEIKEDLKRALSQGLCTRGIFDADKVRVIK